MFKPIEKERFIEIVTKEYGANVYLASDLWFIRPVDHLHDTEEEIRGNLALMGKAWFEQNNPKAEALERHQYILYAAADRSISCGICRSLKRSPAHNLEPIETRAALATFEKRRLN